MTRYTIETVTFVKYHAVHRSGGRGRNRKRRAKTIPIYYSRRVAVEAPHDESCRCEVCRFWS